METPELTLKEALQKVNELGYKYIRIEYNGAGDSGSIDDPEFYETQEDCENVRISNLDYRERFAELQKRREQCNPYLKPITDKIDKVLSHIEDWWNNDGGFGHIQINTETGEYFIDNNVNYTESENYTHEGKLD